jgi:CubicO group peptidase (beta-lactamase class C family)
MGYILSSIVIALTLAAAAGAQEPSPIDPASLRRSSFTWTQPEREFGFGHWDEVFPGRMVERGHTSRPLPAGRPLPGLESGPHAAALDRFIADEKVAGLLILQDGTARLERYALGHSAAGRWTSQSVAKSVTSTLVGAAVKDGFITSLDDPVTRDIPALSGSGYDGVTVRHVLTMTSGVKWNEDYTDLKSDAARFYSEAVTPGLDATVSYMRRLPRESAPGSKWVYKTGETHLLGVLVTAATKRPLTRYLSEKIWKPAGMEAPAVWMTDRSSHELAGCCLQASLRDFARIGQLVLDEGRIDGRSIVPDGWFAAATTTQVATTTPGRGYGYQWWTNADGTFAAIGIHGQLLHVDRARKLVVAINSAWPVATSTERSATRQKMLGTIAALVDADR